MRALIFELRPETLAAEGLVAVLERQIEAVQARHGVTVHASLGKEPDVPFAVKEAAYRIAREALHNTVKHARATTVDVTLHWDAEELLLTVADNGRGFEADGDFTGRLGLRAMQERAALLGGEVRIASAPGTGTSLHARIPTANCAGTALAG
jgi:signal transduction histidine kinase